MHGEKTEVLTTNASLYFLALHTESITLLYDYTEMLLAQSSSQKVKELRVELNQEKGSRLQIESRYKEKVQNQAREIEAFKVRMQSTHTQ